MAGAARRRAWTLIVGSAVIASACGGTGPTGQPGATIDPSGAVATSGPSGAPAIGFPDTADPAGAAARERQLVAEIRDESGMPALLGERATAFFAGFEAITTEDALALLGDVAAAVDSGRPPPGAETAGRSRVASGWDANALLDGILLASVRDRLGAGTRAAAIDTSLFADTAFTVSAFMSMLTGIVQSAAEGGSWTLPRQETIEQTIDGLRHQVELHQTLSTTTGGGRVTVDISLAATDRVFAADGSFVALYTSTTEGHFEVDACPTADAIAAGTYRFTTRHELNEVGGAANVRSTGGRTANAPFRLVNGEDAHLVEIQADMALEAEASGPGSPSGPGPASAFDWTASQSMGIVMPAGGSTTVTVGSATASGPGSERASGAMLLTAGMAQMFFGQVAREAETFWRSGKCIELGTSEDSRKVEAGERVEVEVTAHAKFGDGGEVERPIVAEFSGTDSIDPPAGTEMDYPAKVTFTAGSERGDKGTINLTQTSIRGIGKKTLEFEVEPLTLDLTMDGHVMAAGLAMDMTFPRTRLEANDEGVFVGTGLATFSGTITSGGCSKSFSGADDVTVRVTVDEEDREHATIGAIPGGSGIIRVPFTCQGATTNFPVPYAVFFGAFSTGISLPTVTIDETTSLPIPGGGGSVRVTLERPRDP